jgi:hypothetical protein
MAQVILEQVRKVYADSGFVAVHLDEKHLNLFYGATGKTLSRSPASPA